MSGDLELEHLPKQFTREDLHTLVFDFMFKHHVTYGNNGEVVFDQTNIKGSMGLYFSDGSSFDVKDNDIPPSMGFDGPASFLGWIEQRLTAVGEIEKRKRKGKLSITLKDDKWIVGGPHVPVGGVSFSEMSELLAWVEEHINGW